MGRSANNKGRSKHGRFVGLPFTVLESVQGKNLSHYEKAFLVDLLTQYTGSNNGMLSPCHSLMKQYGWSTGSLFRTKDSLIKKDFIVVTREGKKLRGFPTLVAVTWLAIDEPRKNIEYDSCIKVSGSPLNTWRTKMLKPS